MPKTSQSTWPFKQPGESLQQNQSAFPPFLLKNMTGNLLSYSRTPTSKWQRTELPSPRLSFLPGMPFIQINWEIYCLRQHAFRYMVDSPCSPWVLSFYTDEEIQIEEEAKYLADRTNIKVKDIDESLPTLSTYDWTIVSKFHFNVKEDAFLAIQLYTPEALDYHFAVHFFDEDTGSQVPTSFLRFLPALYKKNEVHIFRP